MDWRLRNRLAAKIASKWLPNRTICLFYYISNQNIGEKEPTKQNNLISLRNFSTSCYSEIVIPNLKRRQNAFNQLTAQDRWRAHLVNRKLNGGITNSKSVNSFLIKSSQAAKIPQMFSIDLAMMHVIAFSWTVTTKTYNRWFPQQHKIKSKIILRKLFIALRTRRYIKPHRNLK